MREIEFALALFLISVRSSMELRAIDEINWSLSSARVSRNQRGVWQCTIWNRRESPLLVSSRPIPTHTGTAPSLPSET